MIIVPCPSCSSGDHTGHVEHWGVRPEGVIDGEFCYCKGDCKPPEFDPIAEAFKRGYEEGQTDLLHPEFGSVWRRPDGEFFQAYNQGREDVLRFLVGSYRRLADKRDKRFGAILRRGDMVAPGLGWAADMAETMLKDKVKGE